MTMTCKSLFVLLFVTASTVAQQQPQPSFQSRLQALVKRDEPAATNNYQLELTIERDNKTARYKVTLNSGTVSAELVDHLPVKIDLSAPLTISFSASFTPFETKGGEVALTLSRSLAYKTMAPVQGSVPGAQKEVTLTKSMPLTTKVALSPGKPIVIFEDDAEKISLKLTQIE